MAAPSSSLAKAVDRVLRSEGEDLESWLSAQAAEGKPLREIAYEIRLLTGVAVSHETLRRWIEQIGSAKPAGAS